MGGAGREESVRAEIVPVGGLAALGCGAADGVAGEQPVWTGLGRRLPIKTDRLIGQLIRFAESKAGTGNVLVVLFEDMKKDLPSIVRQVSGFLGVAPLSEPEVALVVEKCGFTYMQAHQGLFEMHPPHILQVDAELFVQGTTDRHRDVPADLRRRIGAW